MTRVVCTLAAGLLLVASISVCPAAEPPDEQFYDIDIPKLNAAEALNRLAEQTGAIMLFPYDLAKSREANAVIGRYTLVDALSTLLEGSGLSSGLSDKRVIQISSNETTERNQEEGEMATVKLPFRKKVTGFLASIFVASGASAQEPAESGVVELEEIIVTAARREQRAQDFAGGLQVFSGVELDRLGADGFEDYLLTVPGISFRDQGNGGIRIAMRGVSNIGGGDLGTGDTVSTIGVYLNDVPVAGRSVPADLASYDLKRIEVLKGPQGTLYGEGAMGGAVKMVLNAPNLGEYEGKGDISVSSTAGGGLNYRVRGAVSIPLAEDRVALRLTGTYRNDDGFVDNVLTGVSDQNSENAYSIRGILFAQITDDFTAEVLALHDVLDQDDFPHIDKPLGDLKVSIAEDRFNEGIASLYGLTLKYNFGSVELTSVSSFYTFERDNLFRFPLASAVFGTLAPVTQDPFIATVGFDSIAQEFRLVSEGDNRFDWVAGVFYRDLDQDRFNEFFIIPSEVGTVNDALAAIGVSSLGPNGSFFTGLAVETFEQFAVYAEGNYQLTDNLELTAGLRWYDEKNTADNDSVGYGLFSGVGGQTMQQFDDDGVVPKISLSWSATDNRLLYVSAAQGFRSSAINQNADLVGDDGAESDSLWNYEIGTKTTSADGRFLFNASAFFIDWKDAQFIARTFSPAAGIPIGHLENAGDAEVYGVEIELAAVPTDTFSFGGTIGYTHSELTKTLGDGIVGEELPNVPEWTASGFGEYRRPYARGEGFVRLDAQYMGDQATRLVSDVFDAAALDSYTLANLRIGYETAGWGVTLFADNLFDERAELGRGLVSLSPLANAERFSITRPRTIGVTLQRSFE